MFIKLHRFTDKGITYINKTLIIEVTRYPRNDYTLVETCNNENYSVIETPEEIMDLIYERTSFIKKHHEEQMRMQKFNRELERRQNE